MSSSYKQKKLRTLATRKKTRKRRAEDGMVFEDDSSRLFQPPSVRNPRWKKPSMDAVVSTIAKSKRQKKAEKKRRKILANQKQDDDIGEKIEECTAHDDEVQEDEELDDVETIAALPKTPLRLCKSLEDVVANAIAKHKEIRCKDGRLKTKVLLLVDARSIFKLLKKKLNIRQEMVKPKSRLGVGSAKKPELVYKNIGLVKTPLDRFKGINKSALMGYKSGKVSTLLAEDVTFYPYTDLNVQHVIFVAKEVSSVVNLDRHLLQKVALHSFIIDDKSTTGVSEVQLNSLKKGYELQ